MGQSKSAAKLIEVQGQRWSYCSYGDPQGEVVVYLHGFASSAAEAAVADDTARRHKLHLLAFNRPGYHQSGTAVPAQLDLVVSGMQQALHALGVEVRAVVGVSGGTPYALALAARLGASLRSVLLVSAHGPVQQAQVRAQFNPIARFGFWSARRWPRCCRALLALEAAALRGMPRVVLRLMRGGLSGPDQRTLREPALRDLLVCSIREGASQGAAGVWRDLQLYSHPWTPAVPALPVEIWQGAQDHVVPLICAQALAAQLPAARLRVFADEGHFSLPLRHADAILGAVSEALARPA